MTIKSPATTYSTLLLLLTLAALSSCILAQTNSTTQKWVNPRRGMIYGKLNVRNIPITAFENHLFGPVKSVTYKTYNEDTANGNTPHSLADSGTNTYDRSGHLIDQISYNSSGLINYHYVYKYDADNKHLDSLISVTDTTAPITVLIYRYDKHGYKTQEINLDLKYSPYQRCEITNDSAGRVKYRLQYSTDDRLTSTDSFEYNDQGFEIRYASLRKVKDGRHYVINAKYDQKGDPIETTLTAEFNQNQTKTIYINDSNGWSIETRFFQNDSTLLKYKKFTHDQWGHELSLETYNAQGTLVDDDTHYYELETDDVGNVTVQKTYLLRQGKRVLSSRVESVISYY